VERRWGDQLQSAECRAVRRSALRRCDGGLGVQLPTGHIMPATVRSPIDVRPDHGRCQVRRSVTDPLGGGPPVLRVGDEMSHVKICYLEIPAKTAEASADFYSTIFGWKVRRRGDGELAFDDTGGVSGTWVKESDRTPDERTRTYIMVDAIADTLQRIEAAGGRVLTPRTDIGAGMGAFAAFADPVGNEFGLYEEPRR